MNNEELYILWTTGDEKTAENMVFMYGHNSMKKGWWNKVTVIIWGAASELAAENNCIQERIKEMINDGVSFIACKACADKLGVTGRLEQLGVDVFYTGETLTDIIREGKKLLSV